MDMEKIMAYVEKIAENLEGLVCAIGCVCLLMGQFM